MCEELFATAESPQKRLKLACGDHAHHDCFRVVVECLAESFLSFQAVRDHMPRCKGPHCRDSEVPVLAESSELAFKLFTAARDCELRSNLAILGTTLTRENDDRIPVAEPAATDYHRDQILKEYTRVAAPSFAPPARSSVEVVIPSPQIEEFDRLFDLTCSGSFHRTRSSSPSPTVATTNTLSLQVPEYVLQDVDKLRHKYIEHLLSTCKKLSFSTLCQLGTLRLVDILQVSFFESGPFAPHSCYLFTNYLLICDIDGSTFRLIPIDGPAVSPTNESTFSISVRGDTNTTVWIHSENPGVVEKWIVATSDTSTQFPSQFLTSTFVLPEFQERNFEEVKETGKGAKSELQSSPVGLKVNATHPENHTEIHHEPRDHRTGNTSPQHTPFSSSSTNMDNSGRSESVFTNLTVFEDGSDSDVDSDQEIINKLAAAKLLSVRLQQAVSGETDLIDHMLREMKALSRTFAEFVSSFDRVAGAVSP